MRPAPAHLIADISYQADLLRCSCGETMGADQGRDWLKHRNANGVPLRNMGNGFRRTKPRDGSWSMK